ncbi:hypothetical protein HY792_07430 [Candidatus Desantisbacteria bacterium]|nr:hypothetical protein [Candidatus Desantisbacteria bacterium]
MIDTIMPNGYNLDIENPHMLEDVQTYTIAELVAMIHDSFRRSDTLLERLKKELANGI